MRIRCPFCGERDSSEFSYRGAHVRRPEQEDARGEAAFFDAIYVRSNPSGRHDELWYHNFGCRSWLVVTRDTRTHEIFAVGYATGASDR